MPMMRAIWRLPDGSSVVEDEQTRERQVRDVHGTIKRTLAASDEVRSDDADRVLLLEEVDIPAADTSAFPRAQALYAKRRRGELPTQGELDTYAAEWAARNPASAMLREHGVVDVVVREIAGLRVTDFVSRKRGRIGDGAEFLGFEAEHADIR